MLPVEPTLGPSLRAWARRVDGVSLLTCYLVALLALPSRLAFAPLGGAGSPAVILGLLGFAIWAYFHVRRSEPWEQGRQPVRTACLVFVFAVGLSYIIAMTRAIDPAESSTAQLGIVMLLSWTGVLAMANDSIPSTERFLVLLRRISLAGGLLALLGLAQFATGRTLVDIISIPGLSANQSLAAITSRAGFNRPAGTAIHPIEFGAVLTMILPIALNLAMVDRGRGVVVRWMPVAAMSLAVVTSISRSALICAAVGLVLLAPSWTRTVRWIVAATTSVFLGVVFVVIPGLVEAVVGLFTGISTDSSASSRVDSYGLAWEFIERSPIFGRGFSTFLPKYRILDNQYLALLIELGVVGLMAMLALVVSAMMCGRLVATTTGTERGRMLGQALFAACAAGGVGLAFYDGLGFPMAAGLLFFVLGLSGAQWRLARADRPKPPGRPAVQGGEAVSEQAPAHRRSA